MTSSKSLSIYEHTILLSLCARQSVLEEIFYPVRPDISARKKLNNIYYISSADSETRQFSFSWGKWPSFQNNKFTLVSPSRDLVLCAEDRCDNTEHDRPQRGRISCNGRAERFMTRGDPARKHLLPVPSKQAYTNISNRADKCDDATLLIVPVRHCILNR